MIWCDTQAKTNLSALNTLQFRHIVAQWVRECTHTSPLPHLSCASSPSPCYSSDLSGVKTRYSYAYFCFLLPNTQHLQLPGKFFTIQRLVIILFLLLVFFSHFHRVFPFSPLFLPLSLAAFCLCINSFSCRRRRLCFNSLGQRVFD